MFRRWGPGCQRGFDGACAQWLYQMRTDLGRLDAIPEILQVGPALNLRGCMLGGAAGAVIYRPENA